MPMSRLKAAIGKMRSQKVKSRLLAAFLMFTFAMALACTVAQPAASTDGNITAGTSYYGLTVIEWIFAFLAVAMLVLYALHHHPYELFATIGFAASDHGAHPSKPQA